MTESIHSEGGVRKRWFRGGGGGKNKITPNTMTSISSKNRSTTTTGSSGNNKNNNYPTNSTDTNTNALNQTATSQSLLPKGILKNKNDPIASSAIKKLDPWSKNKSAKISPPTATTNATHKPSWFCRTIQFQKLCDTAFDIVDADGSGTVDVNELYSGLLLIHLKLGTYAGPAACRPLSRERCQTIFTKMDQDRSGRLDRTEFRNVMMVLFSNVIFRVAVQWSMTLLIVPFVARSILDGLVHIVQAVMTWIQTRDEHSEWIYQMEWSILNAWNGLVHWMPSTLMYTGTTVYRYGAMIPESVWEALPLTVLSTILGIAVIPYIIFQVDDFFQAIADRKVTRAERDNAGPWI